MKKNLLLALTALWCGLTTVHAEENPPKPGDEAKDFTLKTLDDQSVKLSDLRKDGPVVLVVLRGWPGYQCPVCSRQVQDYIQSAPEFAAKSARVVMIFPGPAPDLKAHAQEFLKNKDWPKEFVFLTDPDYEFTHAYGLRWDAPKETAYPSTFVIDRMGVVRFAKISRTHGDRTKAADVLKELAPLGGD